MIGSERRISALFVEINAILSRMGKDPVQQNFNVHLFGLFAKLFKILLTSEKRVDFHIIGRVVSVVGMGLEYGV